MPIKSLHVVTSQDQQIKQPATAVNNVPPQPEEPRGTKRAAEEPAATLHRPDMKRRNQRLFGNLLGTLRRAKYVLFLHLASRHEHDNFAIA